MNKRHKHADLIIAWANGEEIQCWIPWENYWLDCDPTWDEDVEYRVKPKVVHKIGNRYQYKGKDYILACVDDNFKVALISLKCGNRWLEPVKVKDTDFLSEDEWNEITSHCEFQLIE